MKNSEKSTGKKILASLVMGVNAVNVFAPMVQGIDALSKFEGNKEIKNRQEIAMSKTESDKTTGYETLSTVAGYVDGLVFGKVYAASMNITAGSTTVDNWLVGDVMNITNATGVIGTNAGSQGIYTGGTGVVSTNLVTGLQNINFGVGTIIDNKDGWQVVQAGGGTGIIINNTGWQRIYSGAVGSIVNFEGTTQMQQVSNSGTGIIDNLLGGQQMINPNATGIIAVMETGHQYVYQNGTGLVKSMNNGTQHISGGTGTVETMNSGHQMIANGGTGIVEILKDGAQWVNSGTGIVEMTMQGDSGFPQQYIIGANEGTIKTMNGGQQNVWSGGTGTIETMNAGYQAVSTGVGTIVTMNDGGQGVQSGVGTIVTMNDGFQVISIDGAGTIETMNYGGQHISSGGTGTVETMNFGVQMISSGGTGTVETMNEGWQWVSSGGTGTIETMNAGSQRLFSGGSVSINKFLGGTQTLADDGASITGQVVNGGTQHMEAAGLFEGTILNDGMLAYENAGGEVKDLTMNGGRVVLNADTNIYKLTGMFKAAGGTVDMTEDFIGNAPRSYETLTIEHLGGSGGAFKINTDLASETDSDKIEITTSDPGITQYVQVVDESLFNGTEVIGLKSLLFATDPSGNVTFQGVSLDNGGLWELTPTVDSPDGSNWYLRTIEKKVNPSTETLIGNVESTYGLWRSALTDDTLRKRLGDLRIGVEEAGGVWARAKAGSLSGNNYNSKYQTFQVGIDKTVGNKTYGMAVDHSNTSSDLASGSGDGSMTGLSLYMTTYKDSGLYSDVVLRGGKLRSGVNTYGQYPDSLDFDAYGYSASYEIGKTNTQENGWFTEPQAQLVLGHLNGGEYRTARDTYVDRNGVNTLIARVGVVAGRKINKDSDYYFKANVYHEFLGKDKMDLLAANGERMSYEGENSGTWFEVGVGTNIKLSNQTYFYGDVLKTFGGDIKKKWQVNAGLRFAFGGPKKVAPLPVVAPVVAKPVVPKHEEFLDSIYFDFDVDTPRAGEQVKIDNFVKVAKENPDRTYSMVGHTDAIGTDEYNMELSKRRAANVKAAAQAQGVPATQMEEAYQGKAEPADTDSTAEGRANNRRVNIFEYTNK